jgi:hypothetical protein
MRECAFRDAGGPAGAFFINQTAIATNREPLCGCALAFRMTGSETGGDRQIIWRQRGARRHLLFVETRRPKTTKGPGGASCHTNDMLILQFPCFNLVHNRRIEQRRGIAQVAHIAFRNLSQNPAHDLA